MKYFLIGVLLILYTNSYTQNISGIWYGTVNTNEGKSRILITFQKHGDSYQVYSEMPEFIQIDKQVSFDTALLTKNTIHLSLKDYIKITGSIINDSVIHTKFIGTQPFIEQAFILNKINYYPNLQRSQTPMPPFTYESKEVYYYDSLTKINYGGTLTIPLDIKNKTFPAIILLSGSDADDRDNTFGAHKYFMVLADYLTKKGYAVLRTDDRGMGATNGSLAKTTFYDLVNDANAALNFLKRQSIIDSKRIGVLGHSEGGMIAPALAAHNSSVKFIITLAAPAIPFKNIMKQQLITGMLSNSGAEAALLKDTLLMNRLIDAAMTKTERLQSLSTYDPATALKKLKIPVVALYADKDLLINAKENAIAMNNALQAAGNKNYKTFILPGLNHTFQKCIACSVREGVFLEETISPFVLKLIGEWLKNNFEIKSPAFSDFLKSQKN